MLTPASSQLGLVLRQHQELGLVSSWLRLPAAVKLEQDAPVTFQLTRKSRMDAALVLLSQLGIRVP
jgi:hypothetical protein